MAETEKCYYQNELIDMYISQMDPREQIAHNIAIKNLESSFDISKSIGFLQFIKQNNYKIMIDNDVN